MDKIQFNKELVITLKTRFPWLGTQESDVSGADVIRDLCYLYGDAGGDLNEIDEDKEDSDEDPSPAGNFRQEAQRTFDRDNVLDDEDCEDNFNEDSEICDTPGCGNSLADCEGFDGYCGTCADKREEKGVYADEDEDADE